MSIFDRNKPKAGAKKEPIKNNVVDYELYKKTVKEAVAAAHNLDPSDIGDIKADKEHYGTRTIAIKKKDESPTH